MPVLRAWKEDAEFSKRSVPSVSLFAWARGGGPRLRNFSLHYDGSRYVE